MTGKGKFILTLVAVFLIFVGIQVGSLILHPETVRSEKSLLNQYYQIDKNNSQEQLASLTNLQKKYPDSLEGNKALGYWYIRNDRPNAAITQLTKYLNMNPTDLQAIYDLARLYISQKDYTKADALLKYVVNSNNPAMSRLAKREMAQLHDAAQQVEANATIQTKKSLLDIVKSTIFPYIATPKSKLELAHGTATEDENAEHISLTNANPSNIASNPNSPNGSAIDITTNNGASLGSDDNSANMPMTERDKLLNHFYNNQKNNPTIAWASMVELLIKYPDDELALKEAGYFQLHQHHDRIAVYYFMHDYYLTHDPYMALQSAYILQNLHEEKLSYQYFYYASFNKNKPQKLQAELALTNLRYLALKFLPDPYYAEVYYNPFYQSRFKLLVEALVARVGIVLDKIHSWQVYLGYRRTQDNKSGEIGAISQIYNDNAAITSIGTSIQPIPTLPLVGFIEGGKAVDLVYRQRGRWRNDFRTGVAYFTEWGNEARYTFTPTFPFKFKGDLYADTIYYSRYLNTIATIRIRPTLEIFRYETSSLSVYFKGNVIEDRERQFFNNVLEYGPGIVFIPSDRYNVALRYESLSGHYLPANSPSPNPYSQNYHNGILQLDVYFRF